MFPNLVLCIQGRTLVEVLTLIKRGEETAAAIFEIRADYLQEDELSFRALREIKRATKRKLIFTLRKREEGGNRNLDDNYRLQYFLHALKLRYDFIDVEAASSYSLLELLRIKKGKTKLILSYHNFHETDLLDIEQQYNLSLPFRPDIVKIVTMAQRDEDNEAIGQILQKYGFRTPPALTCFCVGELGKVSRIQGYKLGCALTYVALTKENSTAPGQLSYNEFLEGIL